MRLSLVTTWSTACGIAAHSQFLLNAMPGELMEPTVLATRESPVAADPPGVSVLRVWNKRDARSMSDAAAAAITAQAQVVHVELQSGWFEPVDFGKAVMDLRARGVVVTVAMHSIVDVDSDATGPNRAWVEALSLVSMVIVHRDADALRLRTLGVKAPIEIIPLGRVAYHDQSTASARAGLGLQAGPLIATYGFLLPHKGHLELIHATALLSASFPGISLIAASALHPDPSSLRYLAQCLHAVRGLDLSGRVAITGRFMSDLQSMSLLHAADVIVMPYGPTTESASAAVSLALAARRPVVVTDQPIFEALGDAVFRIKASDPEEIARSIRYLIEAPEVAAMLVRNAAMEIERNSWDKIAREHIATWLRLLAS